MLVPVFFQIPNLQEMLLNGVLGNSSFLQNRHWRSLLNGPVRAFTSRCASVLPRSLSETGSGQVVPDEVTLFFRPVVPRLWDYLVQRLDSEWAKVEGRGANSGGQAGGDDGDDSDDEGNEISKEVLDERMLRVLTSSFADMLKRLADPPRTGKNVPEDPAPLRELRSQLRRGGNPDMENVTLFVDLLHCGLGVNDPSLRAFPDTYVKSLIAILSYKDSISSGKVVYALKRVIPYFVDILKFYQVFGETVLVYLLKVSGY